MSLRYHIITEEHIAAILQEMNLVQGEEPDPVAMRPWIIAAWVCLRTQKTGFNDLVKGIRMASGLDWPWSQAVVQATWIGMGRGTPTSGASIAEGNIKLAIITEENIAAIHREVCAFIGEHPPILVTRPWIIAAWVCLHTQDTVFNDLAKGIRASSGIPRHLARNIALSTWQEIDRARRIRMTPDTGSADDRISRTKTRETAQEESLEQTGDLRPSREAGIVALKFSYANLILILPQLKKRSPAELSMAEWRNLRDSVHSSVSLLAYLLGVEEPFKRISRTKTRETAKEESRGQTGDSRPGRRDGVAALKDSYAFLKDTLPALKKRLPTTLSVLEWRELQKSVYGSVSLLACVLGIEEILRNSHPEVFR